MRTLLKLAAVLALVAATASVPSAARYTAPTLVGPSFSSIGPLAFGPDGVLYAADRQAATIFALDLGAQATAGAAGTKSLAAITRRSPRSSARMRSRSRSPISPCIRSHTTRICR